MGSIHNVAQNPREGNAKSMEHNHYHNFTILQFQEDTLSHKFHQIHFEIMFRGLQSSQGFILSAQGFELPSCHIPTIRKQFGWTEGGSRFCPDGGRGQALSRSLEAKQNSPILSATPAELYARAILKDSSVSDPTFFFKFLTPV